MTLILIEDTENILSVIYYDGYCNIFDEEAQPESFPFAANPLVESEEQAATVRGLTTVSKTRVLNRRGEWLSSVIYYDEYHRAVQTQTQQMGGRWDVMTNKYDFSGKVLRTHQRHRSKTDPIVVNQSFVYDHAGRLTKTYHKVNQNERVLLSQVAYNEVGQVKGKGLHGDNPLQNINFKYNIRGWLTHINDLANVEKGNSSSLFALKLSYDEAGFYNGNIGKIDWRSTTDGINRSYTFDYDNLNRLLSADYVHDNPNQTDEDYSVSNISYDHNGNIQTLKRNGLLTLTPNSEDPTRSFKTYGIIDDLSYSYERGTNQRKSNQLINVSDQATTSRGVAGDFVDKNSTSENDYRYDRSGNLKQDRNKTITNIVYNHLNLPVRILFETGNEIRNTYDAAGIKLKSQIVEQGVVLRTTHYKNGFIYEQKNTEPTSKLSFFGTAEGRIVKKEEDFVYEYHYKDHLGNLRVAFQAQEATESQRQVLTMELDKAETEEQEFENVRVVRSSKKDKQGHYSAELTNANQPISKTLQVKKGDRIKASVFATHDPAIAETDPEKAITEAKKDVLLSLGSAAAGTLNTNPIDLQVDIPVNPEISPATTKTIKAPRIRLNLLDFVPVIRNLRALKRAKKAKALEPDMYFVPKGELVLELKDSLGNLIEERREKITISSAVSWEKLVSNFDVPEDGNLEVYIDNSSSEKVYFDDFEIFRTETTVAVVVQENHYYPFGMNMKGIEELDIQSQDITVDEHRWQYNGKEKEESFGLNWTDYGWRNYDPQLSRWHGVDNLAEEYQSISPYVYVANNPIKFIDPDGRYIISVHYSITKGVMDAHGYGKYTSMQVAWGSSLLADHPSGNMLELNNTFGALFSLTPQVHWSDWGTTHETSEIHSYLSNSQTLEYIPGKSKYNYNIWHAMRSDTEAEMGTISRQMAMLRGLIFGWEKIFEAASYGNIDELLKSSANKENLGFIALSQGLHALQDAFAHKGASWGEHSSFDDVYGDTEDAKKYTDAAITVVEVLNGDFSNYYDESGKGKNISLRGMSDKQKTKVIDNLRESISK